MTTNLTAVNRDRKSVLIGRDDEIAETIETLLRVEKPNVILTGEAGVGKTALVNHLAYLIANGLVPDELKGYSVTEVNLNDLLAGDGYRGVFEKKVQDLVNQAVQKGQVILFMDEFHVAETLGQMANGQTPGLGNALKPHLTRADVRIIGATTNDEYNQMKDKALLRRLRRIVLSEPNEEACMKIAEVCIAKYNTRSIKFPDSLAYQFYQASLTFQGVNPDKIVDLADITFAKARIRNMNKLDIKSAKEFISQIVASKTRATPKSIVQL